MSDQFREVVEMIFTHGYEAGVEAGREESSCDLPVENALDGRYSQIDTLIFEAKRILGAKR